MKRIENEKDANDLMETINFILSHDYLRITLNYPGIEKRELKAAHVLLAILDIDDTCAFIKGISKEEWIQRDICHLVDETMYRRSKKLESDLGEDRHKGKRFYNNYESEIAHGDLEKK